MTKLDYITIETAIEKRLIDLVVVGVQIDSGAHFRLCMEVARILEDEYSLLIPFTLSFEEQYYLPILRLSRKEILNDS